MALTHAAPGASGFNIAGIAQAKDLKKRLWFTAGALLVFRLLSFVPLPGIDPLALTSLFHRTQGGVLDFINMFSGGSLERMSLIALGLMPYITASIVIQIATAVSPTLMALKKDGDSGRKTLNQYTRHGTVFLCAVQGYFIAVGLESWGANEGNAAVTDPGILFRVSTAINLVGGSMFSSSRRMTAASHTTRSFSRPERNRPGPTSPASRTHPSGRCAPRRTPESWSKTRPPPSASPWSAPVSSASR